MFLATVSLAACALPSTPVSPKVIQRIAGPDGGWDYASFDAVRRRVLVSRSYGVMSIDVATDEVSQLVAGQGVHASFVLPDGRLLMTNGGSDTVVLANGDTGAIEATIPVGHDPDAAIYDPASARVYVVNAESGDVSVVDPARGKEELRIAVGGKLEAAAVDGAGRLFVNINDVAGVAVIDTRSRRVDRRFALVGCEKPTAIAFTSGRLVSTCSNGVAKVIDADDGRAEMDIPIGPHADSAVVDGQRGRMFIATAGSLVHNGEITVLGLGSASGLAVVDRIPTQRGARTLAEDPLTGRLYLPTGTYVIGLDGTPRVAPGSFKVLVVAP